jgi:hypothetical protein
MSARIQTFTDTAIPALQPGGGQNRFSASGLATWPSTQSSDRRRVGRRAGAEDGPAQAGEGRGRASTRDLLLLPRSRGRRHQTVPAPLTGPTPLRLLPLCRSLVEELLEVTDSPGSPSVAWEPATLAVQCSAVMAAGVLGAGAGEGPGGRLLSGWQLPRRTGI